RVKTAPLTQPLRGFVVVYDNTKNLTGDQIRTTLSSVGYPGAFIGVQGTTVVIRFPSLPVHPPAPSPSPSASPSAKASASPTPTASPIPTVKGRAQVLAA